jgi:hypothetical protein
MIQILFLGRKKNHQFDRDLIGCMQKIIDSIKKVQNPIERFTFKVNRQWRWLDVAKRRIT